MRVCVCVCEYKLSNHGLPLPLRKSMIGFFFFTRMSMRFATDWRLSENIGRPWLVYVHGYLEIFLMCVHD